MYEWRARRKPSAEQTFCVSKLEVHLFHSLSLPLVLLFPPHYRRHNGAYLPSKRRRPRREKRQTTVIRLVDRPKRQLNRGGRCSLARAWPSKQTLTPRCVFSLPSTLTQLVKALSGNGGVDNIFISSSRTLPHGQYRSVRPELVVCGWAATVTR